MQAHNLCENFLVIFFLGCTSTVLSLPPMQPLLIWSPLLGTPENTGVT